MYHDENKRKELIRKITAELKRRDAEDLADFYNQLRRH